MEEVVKLNVARSAVNYIGQPEDVTGLIFERRTLYDRYEPCFCPRVIDIDMLVL